MNLFGAHTRGLVNIIAALILTAVADGWVARVFTTGCSNKVCRSPSVLWQKVEGTDSSTDNKSLTTAEGSTGPIASAILRIAYDGTRFTGWSAANDQGSEAAKMASPKRRRRRRRGARYQAPIKGYVLSVQGLLRYHLAKVYGNIDPSQIVVESSSRTDKGVHAKGMIAMIYGFQNATNQIDWDMSNSSIAGKKKPHPSNSTDSSFFRPVPMNLSKLAFTLNRMLPPDVRIVGIAPIPTTISPTSSVFHPSLSAVSKTYVYNFAITNAQRQVLDPTKRRHIWNIPENSCAQFDLDKAQQACRIFEGTHNFSRFQGAPRGSTDRERRKREHGICIIYSIAVNPVTNPDPPIPMPTATAYTVTVRGNRFLYKMVRLIVGCVVDYGFGKINSTNVEKVLLQQEQDRFSCAPAHGLTLEEVSYNTSFDWQPLRN